VRSPSDFSCCSHRFLKNTVKANLAHQDSIRPGSALIGTYSIPSGLPTIRLWAAFVSLRHSRCAGLLLPSLFVHAHHDEPQG
jgi:hypothetical protein